MNSGFSDPNRRSNGEQQSVASSSSEEEIIKKTGSEIEFGTASCELNRMSCSLAMESQHQQQQQVRPQQRQLVVDHRAQHHVQNGSSSIVSRGIVSWRDPREDYDDRVKIIDEIKKNIELAGTAIDTEKVKQGAAVVEKRLYASAATKEEYLNMKTLDRRIREALTKNWRPPPHPSGGVPSIIPTPNFVPEAPCTSTPPLRNTATMVTFPRPVIASMPHMQQVNGYHGGHIPDSSHMSGRAFIGNGHHSYDVNGGMYPSPSMGYPRGIPLYSGEPSAASKMIPVPGLPSHVKQQLQETSTSTSSTTANGANGRGQKRKPQTEDIDQFRKRVSMICSLESHRLCRGECSTPSCAKVREFLSHITKCQKTNCETVNCTRGKSLLAHFTNCGGQCNMCNAAQEKLRNSQIGALEQQPPPPPLQPQPPPLKRQKVEKPRVEPLLAGKGKSMASLSRGGETSGSSDNKQVNVKIEDGTPESHSSTRNPSKQEVVTVTTTTTAEIEVPGISQVELFTEDEIYVHLEAVKMWIGQSKAKADKIQSMEHKDPCTLCGLEKLYFDPPPLYCNHCGVRIKRSAPYWSGSGISETQHYYCTQCYAKENTIDPEVKKRLTKKKNDEQTSEPWVQCTKCKGWNHMICGLFNNRRNEGLNIVYTCPFCLLRELQSGGRQPLPSTTVLGASDLPKCRLSDHLEERIKRRLGEERIERARSRGKTPEEVETAEGLVIRVVSSVDKKLEVKPRFLEIFKNIDYPSEYPYKSKAILMFQKIEGVEVCLFGMYVQEFGVNCAQPNNRRLYIAYLDSVKYFRPDVKTVSGEALRTFVYHELLIGYLEFSKRRGFGSCYIWACPPLRGEDYILYCHPEIQKTPKAEKLRDWYLSMLGKAAKENVVVELSNMYDFFFTAPDECKATVTAARLPYFEGDYWPGAAEDTLFHLQQEEEEKRRAPRRKGVAKRFTIASEMASNASRDLQLMHKLGNTISPMKEDFIMVHMHHHCHHCRLYITTGFRWVCRQCKSFQLCNRCYMEDQKRDESARHPWNNPRLTHTFDAIAVDDVPADTRDLDENIESEFFDTRQNFLSLCQGNHYQYETLRRAKHSSLMMLYHLHNPTAPAFVLSCNICHLDIETGQGWKCGTCSDFDVCARCYPLHSTRHPHRLTRHATVAEREAQSVEARNERVLQMRKMHELLIHASQCSSAQCQYPKCKVLKNLFRHGTSCKIRMHGGCSPCKKMWALMSCHARLCSDSDCKVPRCRDIKQHTRRLQSLMESRRMAAVKEMIRQRSSTIASAKRDA